MDLIRKAVENSSFILLGDIFAGVTNLIIGICIVRHLGSAEFGKYSFALTFIYQFMLLEDIWMKPILVREMAKGHINGGRLIANSIFLKLAVSFIAILLILLITRVLKCPNDTLHLVYLAVINIPLISIIASYEAVFRANLKMSSYVGISSLNKGLNMLIIFFVLFSKGSVSQLILAMTLSNVLNIFFLQPALNKSLKLDFRIEFGLWRKILKYSLPLFLSGIFISIYSRLGNILLFKIKGEAALGLYACALRLAESFHIVPLAVAGSIFPLMSKYFISSHENFKKIYSLAFHYLSLFFIPLVVTIIFFSRQIINFLYGKAFLPSAAALNILILAEIFVFFGIINNRILVASGNQKIDPIFTGLSLIVSSALNLLLIPRYSFVGVAIAALITYATGPLMGFIFTSTREYSKCMFSSVAKPLLASLVMVWVFFVSIYSARALLILAPFIYCLTLLSIRGINIRSYEFLKADSV